MNYIRLTVPNSIEYDPEIWRAIKEEELQNWIRSLEVEPSVIVIETSYTNRLQKLKWQSLPNVAFVQNDINLNEFGNDKVLSRKHKEALNLVRLYQPHGCVGFVNTSMYNIMDLVQSLENMDYCSCCSPAFVMSVRLEKVFDKWIAHVKVDTES